MPTAILYIRVSTDEQANKGYSLQVQSERLQKFCAQNQIIILAEIHEDYSAKTFNRPEWSNLLKHLEHKNLAKPDQILFTRWDRFSRNAADAYFMIEKLKKMNVQPYATEQPLDLSIPENKIMLAIYLSTSEAENDRRSINVKSGIRKAKQAGRCTSRPPYGYMNITMPNGTKTVVPIEPQATYVKDVFEYICTSDKSIRSIHRTFIANGMKCSISNFWLLIRNPFYCGFINVPKFENIESQLVHGIHNGILSEELFSKVQKTLSRKQKPAYLKLKYNPMLPLRGILECNLCGKMLTGSRSKGKLKYYHYYHCCQGCKYRIRADHVNELFRIELEKLHSSNRIVTQFKVLFTKAYETKIGRTRIDEKSIFTLIEEITERLAKAKLLMASRKIGIEDYQLIKDDCETKIHALGNDLKNVAGTMSRANQSLITATKLFDNLAQVLMVEDSSVKQRLIDLICEKRIIFDGHHFINLFNYNTVNTFKLDNFQGMDDQEILSNQVIKSDCLANNKLDRLPPESSENYLLTHLIELILQIIIEKQLTN